MSAPDASQIEQSLPPKEADRARGGAGAPSKGLFSWKGEALNLLYVAVSRAREILILPGALRPSGKQR